MHILEFITSALTISKLRTVCSYSYIPLTILMIIYNDIIRSNIGWKNKIMVFIIRSCILSLLSMITVYFIGPVFFVLIQCIIFADLIYDFKKESMEQNNHAYEPINDNV